MKHYLYILTHTYYPGYKIGITYDVKKRIKELNSKQAAGEFKEFTRFEFCNEEQAYNVEQKVLAGYDVNLLENSKEVISNNVSLENLMNVICLFKDEFKEGEIPVKKSKERCLDSINKNISNSNRISKNQYDDNFMNNVKIFQENGCPISLIPSESS